LSSDLPPLDSERWRQIEELYHNALERRVYTDRDVR
jgi:hypothetical protein